MKEEDYSGLDFFRLPAALLIIAIHTSPLASYSQTGDFIGTRVVARIAVPFFFMTSAFFVISRYSYHAGKLASFMKKTTVIYGAAMLLYVPVNIYSGYFKVPYLLQEMVKDIVFDGTFYHLWYLPASIAGAGIAWFLVKKIDYAGALTVTAVLYVIGVFGDSYYGMAEKVPCLKRFYDSIFEVSDYTRNGIFFAPLFFVLGGFIADGRRRISLGKSICGFGIGFVLLFAEAMKLRYFHLQRHDSMYLFLPLCMYFLFHILLHFRGKRLESIRTLSLALYLIHPMMIVAVRLFAKLFALQSLLVENSIIHYLSVSLLSFVFGAAVAAVYCRRRKLGAAAAAVYRRRRTSGAGGRADDRAYIEINLKHLEHNVRELQNVMPPGCKLMAVVKAEAYGHGAFAVSTHLEKIGVGSFAVATIDEGIRLRTYGIRGEILVLGYTKVCRAFELKKYRLTQTLVDFDYANSLNRQGIRLRVQIKIDSGMHRLGIGWEDGAKVKLVFAMRNLTVCGIFTHLCCAESLKASDVAFTDRQIDHFYVLLENLQEEGVPIPAIHIQSSYGLLNYPNLNCDYVRAGIALYGCLSSPDDQTVLKVDLRPVLSLKSRVILIRPVNKGDSAGYDRCFTAERDSRIAVVPIGYADGYPRSLSCGKGSVRIRRQAVPIIGRICMDQLIVDVTDIADIAVGDVVTLIGAGEDDALSAPFVADCSGSISNELLCRMGARLPVMTR